MKKKTMTMKVLFKNAWTLARKGAKQFGGSVKEYFAKALEQAWRIKKEFENPESTLEIKQWFMNKNFTREEAMVAEMSDRKVERETEKAVLIKFFGKYGTMTKWVPKSCLVA